MHRINLMRQRDMPERATLVRYAIRMGCCCPSPTVIFPLHLQDLPDGLPSLYALSLVLKISTAVMRRCRAINRLAVKGVRKPTF